MSQFANPDVTFRKIVSKISVSKLMHMSVSVHEPKTDSDFTFSTPTCVEYFIGLRVKCKNGDWGVSEGQCKHKCEDTCVCGGSGFGSCPNCQ